MKQIVGALRRTKFGAVAALFLLVAVAVALPPRTASAATLLDRSLQLSSSVPSIAGTPRTAGGVVAPPGSAANGNKVSHTYIFQAATAGLIKTIQIQYCDSPFGYLSFAPDSIGTCTAPSGFNADNAPAASVKTAGSLGALGAATPHSFAVEGTPTTANVVVVTDAGTNISPSIGDYVSVTFTADATNYFVNPLVTYHDGLGASNQTFFGHIETYAASSDRNTSSVVDEGTVASSIANSVDINTRVQETLKFSVGTEATPATPTAACVPLTGTAALALGDSNNALSASTAYSVTSHFRISTNASSGAEVLYAGRTLTSTAGDTITAVGGTAAASAPGTEQFGLTVDTGDTYNSLTELTPVAPFDTANYAFDPATDTAPAVIASSTGFIACDTAAIKYVANIAPDTEAGLYSTRISYIAVPSY